MSTWVRVTPKRPCPVCGRQRYCSVLSDGTVVNCTKMGGPDARQKTNRNGDTYWVHRVGGPPPSSQPNLAGRPPPHPAPKRIDPSVLHRVYSALLGLLYVSAPHLESLRNRGLSDTDIDRFSYRTLPERAGIRIAREL